ncbi:MAG: ACT domain-containing protein [Anaerolineae bacterium]|nr:ACT domain-containing protein [Anaerolineae bacterium]
MRAARLSARASQADISASSENNTPSGKGVVYGIDNESSEIYTRISVNGENRPGLLSAITGVFASMGVDVRKAEVATQGSSVDDSFYVVDAEGNKIEDAEVLSSMLR